MSSNYVTKRQSLKLLGEILLDRANFNVMTRYIANEANLKMMMNMLRDSSKNIQFEAFHVFKVCASYFRQASGRGARLVIAWSSEQSSVATCFDPFCVIPMLLICDGAIPSVANMNAAVGIRCQSEEAAAD